MFSCIRWYNNWDLNFASKPIYLTISAVALYICLIVKFISHVLYHLTSTIVHNTFMNISLMARRWPKYFEICYHNSARARVFVCVCVYIYIYIYLCVYIHILCLMVFTSCFLMLLIRASNAQSTFRENESDGPGLIPDKRTSSIL